LNKVYTVDALAGIVESLQGRGQTVCFTNGCFDLIHVGHVRYLTAARSRGDVLIVGLNSDRSVSSIKGNRRPIIPQDYRAEVLAGLACVDFVVLFDAPDPLDVIRALKPDVLVKGADWEEEDIIGGDFVKARGGRVERVPVVGGASTSLIIDCILARYG